MNSWASCCWYPLKRKGNSNKITIYTGCFSANTQRAPESQEGTFAYLVILSRFYRDIRILYQKKVFQVAFGKVQLCLDKLSSFGPLQLACSLHISFWGWRNIEEYTFAHIHCCHVNWPHPNSVCASNILSLTHIKVHNGSSDFPSLTQSISPFSLLLTVIWLVLQNCY